MDKKLDALIHLMRQSVAIQLYGNNATMDEISKNLHISKGSVVELLKGVKKSKK